MKGTTSMLIVIILFLISSDGYKINVKRSTSNSIVKQFNKVIIPMISLGIVLTSPIINHADEIIESTKVSLTASDLLTADVKPKIDLLKDVFFTIKLFPTIAEQGDYSQIRLSFRSDPTIELRKTCRKLIPFLEAERRNNFERAYQEMIEELDYLDVLCLRREQKDGLPDAGKKDKEVLDQIYKLTTKFERLLTTVQ